MKKNPNEALQIALNLGKSVPELEDSIATSPSCSVLYAKSILSGRFLLGEKSIASSSYYVCAYLSELDLKEIPESIHRSMLSKGIKENDNFDNEKNYWTKQYFIFCDYLEGKKPQPWWYSKNHAMNWNYRDFDISYLK